VRWEDAVVPLLTGTSDPQTVPESAPMDRRPVEPGLIEAVTQGVRYMVSGVTPGTWFGPGQPIQPYAQEVRGRQFDYPVGYNYRVTPRGEELVSFEQLRALADAYYLLRFVIETRKDQMVRLPWAIKLREGYEEEARDADAARAITEALRYPDHEHNYQTWMRALLEDLLVIDAPCLEPRRAITGAPYSLDLVDGATIKRVINADGRTPTPPDTAYQQVLHGIPAVNLTSDQLVYAPRNVRTSRLYGFSPVEQMVYLVNIALRRDALKLQYYTEGTVPDAIAQVPPEWTSEQVRDFQKHWDGLLEGNTGMRRKLRFTPALKDLTFTKADVLKDEYDDWLARMVCFSFSVSPNALISQVNRSVADNLRQSSEEEGLLPLMTWWKDLMDFLIARYFGAPRYEFAWKDEHEVDALKQARADGEDVRNGIKSVDEVRAARGLPKLGVGNFIVTPTGPVPIGGGASMNPSAPAPPGPEGAPKDGQTPAAQTPGGSALGAEKAAGSGEVQVEGARAAKVRTRVVRRPSPQSYAVVTKRLAGRLGSVFSTTANTARHSIPAQVPEPDAPSRMAKADDPGAWTSADSRRLADQLNLDGWVVLIGEIEDALEEVGLDAVRWAGASLGLADDADEIIRANKAVVQYARTRAAELVGMRRTPEGGLVPNPRAEWAITDTTRDQVRDLVTRAVSEGMTKEQLAEAIQGAGAFSEARAEMIARTELALANTHATQEAWKASGAVRKRRNLLSSDHDSSKPDVCDLNSAAGWVVLEEAFPSGHEGPPYHPNCQCDVEAEVELPGED
jgi:hypothetical protein